MPLPHFAPDARLIVDMHNGPEEWTGQQWNDQIDSAVRNGWQIGVRLVDCPTAINDDEMGDAR